MTDSNAVFNQLEKQKVVPVVRSSSTELAEDMVNHLIIAGFKAIEITLTIPDALGLIEKFSKIEDLIIGAGTVLEVETTETCLEAGVDFIVSPCTNKEIAKACEDRALVILGGLTPSEIQSSFHDGSDIVKVFPADSMGGPKYIKSIKTVFPEIPIVPTGGVTIHNMAEYLDAGASFVGIGNELANEKLLKEEGNKQFVDHAREYLNKTNMILEG